MNTDAPTYYASVDSEMIGELQGKYIVDQLQPGSGSVKQIEILQALLMTITLGFSMKAL